MKANCMPLDDHAAALRESVTLRLLIPLNPIALERMVASTLPFPSVMIFLEVEGILRWLLQGSYRQLSASLAFEGY